MNEQKLVTFVARLGPWLATAPTAWSVGVAVFEVIGWPVAVAVVAGLAVESLGVSSVATAVMLFEYNRAKRKSDPAAPVFAAILASAGYFAAAITLAVLIEVFPPAAVWSVAVFPLLSLAGAVVLALRADHAARLAQIAEEREERKRTRAQERAQDAEIKPAAAQKPAYTCAQCGLGLESSAKLAAHVRWQHRSNAQTEPGANGHNKGVRTLAEVERLLSNGSIDQGVGTWNP